MKRKKPQRKAREWVVHYSPIHGFEECDNSVQNDVDFCLACKERDAGRRIRIREVLPRRRKP